MGNTYPRERPKIRMDRGGVALISSKPAISLKRGKIGPRLLLMTNRKLHMRFRLVPKYTLKVEWPFEWPHSVSKYTRFQSPPGKFE